MYLHHDGVFYSGPESPEKRHWGKFRQNAKWLFPMSYSSMVGSLHCLNSTFPGITDNFSFSPSKITILCPFGIYDLLRGCYDKS